MVVTPALRRCRAANLNRRDGTPVDAGEALLAMAKPARSSVLELDVGNRASASAEPAARASRRR